MAFQEFFPSVKELELATQLLETNIWQNELAVVVRLMGRVQSGEPLRDGLLATGMYYIPLMILRRLSATQVGPMPFIKGITDVCTGGSASGATDQADISLVNAEAMDASLPVLSP